MKQGENFKLRGFTIIEVTLVIAIAGLIFLMVFVALPGLRASQRDTERRESMLEFVSQVKKYQQNNRGALPSGEPVDDVAWSNVQNLASHIKTTWGAFYRDYLGENFMDPDGENYKLEVMKCDATAVDVDCSNDSLTKFYEDFFPYNYTMVVVTQATCAGSKAVGTSNPRKVAVLYIMEGGGTYCTNT